MPLPYPHLPARRLLATAGAAAVLASGGVALAVPAAHADPAAAAPAPAPGIELSSSMMPLDSPDAHSPAGAARSAPAAAELSTSFLGGVDVSSYQHGSPIAWAQVAASGQRFAFVKATESTGYTNPWFASDVAGARAAGLAVGGYHFARPATSATAQADAFASALGTGVSSELPPVLDLESTGGLGQADLVAWTHAFLDRLQARTGRLPMIYTGPSFWSTATGDSHDFTHYPLWVAHYETNSPRVPGGWSTWTFWQYTSSSSVPGVSGAVDASYFQGSPGQLAALTSSGVQPAPVPPNNGAVLRAGSALVGTQALAAGSGQYVAQLQSDGNLVVYGNGRALWSSGTEGNPGARMVLQTDGNLVLYAVSGRALWSSRTAGRATPSLQLQNDGALVVSSGGTPAWSSGTAGTDLLNMGAGLTGGQYLHSPDTSVVALLQSDGNLVAYLNGRAAWSSGTAGHPGDRLVLQSDGNLVLYDANWRPLWATRTVGARAASLQVQSDGNVVLYAGGTARWASGTHF